MAHMFWSTSQQLYSIDCITFTVPHPHALVHLIPTCKYSNFPPIANEEVEESDLPRFCCWYATQLGFQSKQLEGQWELIVFSYFRCTVILRLQWLFQWGINLFSADIETVLSFFDVSKCWASCKILIVSDKRETNGLKVMLSFQMDKDMECLRLSDFPHN